LRIELRGGAIFMLAPDQHSPPLREEQLYDNPHLGDWERLGWLQRLPAKMSEVLAYESSPSSVPAPAKTKVATKRKATAKQAAKAPAKKPASAPKKAASRSTAKPSVAKATQPRATTGSGRPARAGSPGKPAARRATARKTGK
jgi:hypothetical protein